MAAPLPEFGGEERFDVSPERLFAALTDLDVLAKSIPDVVSTQPEGIDRLRAVVRPGFSFLRGKLDLDIELRERDPPHRATLAIASRGIGVKMAVESHLEIAPADGGSRLAWRARLTELSGLVAALSPGLIQSAAEAVIRRGWEQVRAQLAAR
jgi:2-furoyl-CoA dehydrogenase large subunit